MPKKPQAHSDAIRTLIAEYIKNNGITDTQSMSDYLASVGYKGVSTSTVAIIYDELGYVAKRQKSFVWQHNPGRHE